MGLLFGKHWRRFDLLQADRMLRHKRERLNIVGISFNRWKAALLWVRIEPDPDSDRDSGFWHYRREVMDRADYVCSECKRNVVVEFPLRRRKPWQPLPLGWICVGKKTYCQYCVRQFAAPGSEVQP